jgi:hypothetical protein
MGAVPSVPKVKAVLNGKEPAVVLAAAHSLFLLGDRQEAYEIDYEVLLGERKGAEGFVMGHFGDPLLDIATLAVGQNGNRIEKIQRWLY